MQQEELFSRRGLTRLLIPLVLEQFLSYSLGMADTIMVSSLGVDAVSGVSLVDAIHVLMNSIFSSLAAGGAVVCAQYLGQREEGKACQAGKQLLLSCTVVALAVMILFLALYRVMLHLIFGSVNAEVMRSAQIYFVITTCAYPFIALYQAGASIFRAQGNSRVAMRNAVVMNITNIGGNALLIFVCKLGVAGAAIATTGSRIICAVTVLWMLKNSQNRVYIDRYTSIRWNGAMNRRILRIGIPNGLDGGMFQFGKICLQSLISTFGTASIAANAIANNFAQIQIIPGMAFSLAMITVVGQAVGAADKQRAKQYARKLMALDYLVLGINIGLIMLFHRPLLGLYAVASDPQVGDLVLKLLVFHSICAVLFWPAAFTLPNVFRAAGDAKYTMVVSIFSMWIFRIGFGYLLGGYLNWGVFGVWVAMVVDWVVRLLCFLWRLRKDRWLKASID